MNKSFLELLKAEREAIHTIDYFEETAVCFLDKSENSDDTNDKKVYKEIASDCEKSATEAKENLLQIRKELKNYIA